MLKVSTKKEALDVSRVFVGDSYYDNYGSMNAGYPIYRSVEDSSEYICDLGDRLEVNLSDGSSRNIWIDDGERRAESDGEKDMERKLNDSRWIANSIACLASEMIKTYVKDGIYGTEEFNTWATIKGLAETLIDTANIEQ